MQYTSTRGNEIRVDFRTALLSGLADDGGLYAVSYTHLTLPTNREV